MGTESTVAQLPTELFRMRKSEELLCEWFRIQTDLTGHERVVALYSWYDQMERHAALFGYALAS